MDYFFMGFAAVILILNLVAFFGRVVPGTTIFDRLIGIGAIGTNTILFLLVLGILAGRLDKYIDVAIALAATGFLMLLALGRYFEKKGDIDIND